MSELRTVDVATLSSDGCTDWLLMKHTRQVIGIACDSWGAARVELQVSLNGEDACPGIEINGGQNQVLTRNRAVVLEIPCHIRLMGHSITSPIHLEVYVDRSEPKPATLNLEETLLLVDGHSEWLPLTTTTDCISVTSESWRNHAKVVLEHTLDGRFTFPMGMDGEDFVCKGNRSVLVEVGGLVRIRGSSIATPVRLTVASFDTKRGKKDEKRSVNSRMMDLIQNKDEAKGYSARDFANALSCAASTVHSTHTWKELQRMREATLMEVQQRSKNDSKRTND